MNLRDYKLPFGSIAFIYSPSDIELVNDLKENILSCIVVEDLTQDKILQINNQLLLTNDSIYLFIPLHSFFNNSYLNLNQISSFTNVIYIRSGNFIHLNKNLKINNNNYKNVDCLVNHKFVENNSPSELENYLYVFLQKDFKELSLFEQYCVIDFGIGIFNQRLEDFSSYYCDINSPEIEKITKEELLEFYKKLVNHPFFPFSRFRFQDSLTKFISNPDFTMKDVREEILDISDYDFIINISAYDWHRYLNENILEYKPKFMETTPVRKLYFYVKESNSIVGLVDFFIETTFDDEEDFEIIVFDKPYYLGFSDISEKIVDSPFPLLQNPKLSRELLNYF